MDHLLFDDKTLTSKPSEYSVSEISEILKLTLEETFSFVRIRGEISGLKTHSSGHIYFNLKDENAVLNTVCWRGVASSLPFRPEDGLEVICSGKISIYAGRSNYQLIINKIEIAGEGALLALLEKRKKKLEAEGIFDPAHKKSLPYLPKIIGVITSPTGAVIKDILHRIQDRFPTHVLVWGVPVQGQDAVGKIVDAIKGFNSMTQQKPEVIIVARGGGSIEDLMPFNEESVVRAVFESEIPIISAVGHETDTTLIDFAADLRSPTPTAAAEACVPVKRDLEYFITKIDERLKLSLPNMIKRSEDRLRLTSFSLYQFASRLDKIEDRIQNLWQMVSKSFEYYIATQNQRVINLGKLLNSYDYKNVLKRGYAVIRSESNVVSSVKGYLRDSRKIYGIDFSTLIPRFDQSDNILYAKYTDRYDEAPINQECTPVRLAAGGLCDPRGKAGFYPGGTRDKTYCPIVQDQSSAQCTGLKKGFNDPKAMELFCPGSMISPTSEHGKRICLSGSAGEWLFETKEGYYKYISGTSPSEFFKQNCNKPFPSKYCSSISGGLTVPAIEVASASSGWATWPAGKANTTQTGTCATALGFVERKKFTVWDYPQDVICANPTVTGSACTNKFNDFNNNVKVAVNNKLATKAKNAADTESRNLTDSEITAEWGTIDPFIVGYSSVPEGWYYRWWISNLPPKRLIDDLGNTTIENPCVKGNP